MNQEQLQQYVNDYETFRDWMGHPSYAKTIERIQAEILWVEEEIKTLTLNSRVIPADELSDLRGYHNGLTLVLNWIEQTEELGRKAKGILTLRSEALGIKKEKTQ